MRSGALACVRATKEVNEWTRDCLVEAIRRYNYRTALTWDHARYPAPANVHSLMACGCASCEEDAGRLGYDFAAMRRGVLALRQRLERLTPAEVRALAAGRPGLMDFLGLLGSRWSRARLGAVPRPYTGRAHGRISSAAVREARGPR